MRLVCGHGQVHFGQCRIFATLLLRYLQLKVSLHSDATANASRKQEIGVKHEFWLAAFEGTEFENHTLDDLVGTVEDFRPDQNCR